MNPISHFFSGSGSREHQTVIILLWWFQCFLFTWNLVFYDLISTGLRTFYLHNIEDYVTPLYPSPLSIQIIPILQDPHVVSHPAAALAADVIWFRFAVFYFLRGVVYGGVQVIRIGVVPGFLGVPQSFFWWEFAGRKPPPCQLSRKEFKVYQQIVQGQWWLRTRTSGLSWPWSPPSTHQTPPPSRQIIYPDVAPL